VPGDPLPKEAWEIEYPARGDPEIARRIKESMDKNGFNAVLDDERGWDHGVWTPMMLVRPQADLPIIQISIPKGGDKVTEEAIRWGKALEPFRDEGWAILGSGHTYHNFKAIIEPIMGVPGATDAKDNRAFEQKLEEVVALKDKNKRLEEIANWRSFPLADYVHPPGADEHFTPFLVNMGAAGPDVGKKLGEWPMFGTVSSSYIWA